MLDERDDETLAMDAAGGDREAFGRLLERHHDRIYRLGWRLTGSAAEAEDLAQDVCVGLAAKLRGFRGEARFATWLYKVVLNAGRDRLRARARQARLATDFTEVDALRRAGNDARADELAWLRAALAALKPDLRETAALVLDDEMTHAQAAAALGVGESTVSWRLAEIRKALRAQAMNDERSVR
jgi:RNA polymerase sigma-70 factor (ECF subfamily)